MNNNILQSKYDDWNTSIFIGFASLIIIFRFALTADLGVHTIYAPHDELLYILRAYSLLTDGSLGIYDARTLVKLPGFSFFLAALRFLGFETRFCDYASARTTGRWSAPHTASHSPCW